MTDHDLRARYEALPYEGQAYRVTHPDRLAVIARLGGVPAPDPRQARVLEIGCGDGLNLIAMAEGLPKAELVGVDISESILEPGRALIEAAGAHNVTLRTGALPDLPSDLGRFDYVILHGVYSWLPPAAREVALARVADLLTPHGAAYVSYNTYPGWHLRALARGIMQLEADPATPPAEQVHRATRLLQYVAQELEEEGHHSLVLAYAARHLSERSPSYLFHDYLAPHNTPVTVTDFVREAHAAGLEYAGEAQGGAAAVASMQLPETLQGLLAAESDWLRREQLLDHLRNTGFRRTVLCRRDARVDHERPPGLAMSELHLAVRGYPKSPRADIAPGEPAEFVTRDEVEVTCHAPMVKAALAVLCAAHPATVSWPDLLQQVTDKVPDAWQQPESELADALVQLFALELIDLLPRPLDLPQQTPERPRVLRLARVQAAAGAERVTNAYHEALDLPPLQRRIVAACDGTRTAADVVEAVLADIAEGRLTVHLDGDAVDDRDLVSEAVARAVPDEVGHLARMALLPAQGR